MKKIGSRCVSCPQIITQNFNEIDMWKMLQLRNSIEIVMTEDPLDITVDLAQGHCEVPRKTIKMIEEL
jgi:hypothetical protein